MITQMIAVAIILIWRLLTADAAGATIAAFFRVFSALLMDLLRVSCLYFCRIFVLNNCLAHFVLLWLFLRSLCLRTIKRFSITFFLFFNELNIDVVQTSERVNTAVILYSA